MHSLQGPEAIAFGFREDYEKSKEIWFTVSSLKKPKAVAFDLDET